MLYLFRPIPENENMGSTLRIHSRSSVTIPELVRPVSPAQSNRDSMISASSAGSDSAPPVPPKYSIGRHSYQE